MEESLFLSIVTESEGMYVFEFYVAVVFSAQFEHLNTNFGLIACACIK